MAPERVEFPMKVTLKVWCVLGRYFLCQMLSVQHRGTGDHKSRGESIPSSVIVIFPPEGVVAPARYIATPRNPICNNILIGSGDATLTSKVECEVGTNYLCRLRFAT